MEGENAWRSTTVKNVMEKESFLKDITEGEVVSTKKCEGKRKTMKKHNKNIESRREI